MKSSLRFASSHCCTCEAELSLRAGDGNCVFQLQDTIKLIACYVSVQEWTSGSDCHIIRALATRDGWISEPDCSKVLSSERFCFIAWVGHSAASIHP
jgi:hypothetical protein